MTTEAAASDATTPSAQQQDGAVPVRSSADALANWSRERMSATLFIVGILVSWEVATRVGVLPGAFVPPLSKIIAELASIVPDPSFWALVGSTIRNWGIGLAIAIVIGIPLGLAIGLNDWVDRATRPIVEFLRPVPPVALIPVVVLIHGTGMAGAIFLAAFASVWPLVVQSTSGARSIDPVAHQTARSLRLGPLRRFFTVTLPSAAPYVVTGIRISAAIALILVVTAGIIIGTPGVGKEITQAASGANYPRMYAMILVSGLLGLTINLSVTALERAFLVWTPSVRSRKE